MLRSVSSRLAFSLAVCLSLFLLCSAAAPCLGAAQPDSAELYQKHCANCHPDRSKLKPDEPLARVLRVPPPGMPAFGADKLSESEVDALASYLPNSLPATKGPAVHPKADPAPPSGQDRPKKRKSRFSGFGTDDL